MPFWAPGTPARFPRFLRMKSYMMTFLPVFTLAQPPDQCSPIDMMPVAMTHVLFGRSHRA